MSEPFIGQIMTTAFPFAPAHWAQCDGQLLPIQQNQALFTLLGTMYGGDGKTNFQLPDLRGRTPIGACTSVDPSWQPQVFAQGQSIGAEAITLTIAQIPSHTHLLAATGAAATDGSPSASEVLAMSSPAVYGPAQNLVGLTGGPLPAQGTQPHNNMQPFQAINMCIALAGNWPSRN